MKDCMSERDHHVRHLHYHHNGSGDSEDGEDDDLPCIIGGEGEGAASSSWLLNYGNPTKFS